MFLKLEYSLTKTVSLLPITAENSSCNDDLRDIYNEKETKMKGSSLDEFHHCVHCLLSTYRSMCNIADNMRAVFHVLTDTWQYTILHYVIAVRTAV